MSIEVRTLLTILFLGGSLLWASDWFFSEPNLVNSPSMSVPDTRLSYTTSTTLNFTKRCIDGDRTRKTTIEYCDAALEQPLFLTRDIHLDTLLARGETKFIIYMQLIHSSSNFARENNDDYFDGAINDFTKAITLDPSNAKARLLRATAYVSISGKIKQGLPDVKWLIKQKPTNTDALVLLARIYNDASDVKKAQNIISKAISINSENSDAYWVRAITHWLQSNKLEAIQDLNKAISIDSENFDALYLRALYYKELGEYEKALSSINQNILLTPLWYAPWDLKGDILNLLGEPEKALHAYSLAYDYAPPFIIDPLKKGGKVFLKLTQYPEAIAAFTKALEKFDFLTSTWPVYLLRSEAYGRSKQFEKAVADASTYAEKTISKKDGRGPDRQCWWLAQAGKLDEALPHCERALQINPNHAQFHYSMGFVQDKLGNQEEALKSFARASTLDPDVEEHRKSLDWLEEEGN